MYEIEKDAACAYDKVARALSRPPNFPRPGKIIGKRSKSADKCVTDAIEAAEAFVNDTEVIALHNTKSHSNINHGRSSGLSFYK